MIGYPLSANEHVPPSGRGRNFMVAIFFSCVALFSALALASSIKDVLWASIASSWPVVDGEVISSRLQNSCKNLASYLPVVRYRYRVKDREYVGRRIAFGSHVCGSEAYASRVTSAYPEGRIIPVHFDPASPEESTLTAGQAEVGTWPVMLLALLFLTISLPVAHHFARLCLPSKPL